MADGKIVIKTSIDTAEALKSIQALSGAVSKVFDGADSPDFTNTAQSAEKAVKAVDKVEIELEQVTEEAKNAGSASKQAGADMQQSFSKAETQASSLLRVVKGIMFGYTGKKLVDYFIGSNTDMEQYITSFETMLGSAEKAKDLMSDLQGMANVTPFETTQLTSATQTLLAFGEKVENLQDDLSMLGDISQGNAEKLSSLSLAFGQIQSTGYLMGQDLLQLINVGFNPLQVISEKTGESMESLKQKMSDGKISFDMVREAMKSATSEGGLFYQAMEKQSKTVSGMLSTLKDEFVQFGRDSGQEAFGQLSEYLGDLLEQLERAKADGTLAEIAEDVGNAVSAVVQTLINATKFVVEHRKALTVLASVYVGWKASMVMGSVITNVINGIKQITDVVKAVTVVHQLHTGALTLENAAQLQSAAGSQVAAVSKAAETAATKGATAAQIGYNVALSANPIMLVISAVAALTAGLLMFTATAEDSTQKIDELKQKSMDLYAELNELESTVKDINAENEIETRKRLIDAILALGEGKISVLELEKKSVEELLAMYKELNAEAAKTTYNELSNKFDEQNDKLLNALRRGAVRESSSVGDAESYDLITNLIDKLESMDDGLSAQKYLEDLSSNLKAAGYEAAESTQAIDALLASVTEESKNAVDAQSAMIMSSPEYIKAQEEKSAALKNLTEAQKEQARIAELSAAAQANAATVTENFGQTWKDTAKSITTAASALGEFDENGKLSLSTAYSLIDAGYGSALQFDAETNSIYLNIEALKDLIAAKNDAAIATLNEQLAEQNAEQVRLQLALQYESNAQKAAEYVKQLNLVTQAIRDIESEIDAQKILGETIANNNWDYFGGGGGSNKTAEEIAEEGYQKELAYQQWRNKMGYQSDEDYLAARIALRIKYADMSVDTERSALLAEKQLKEQIAKAEETQTKADYDAAIKAQKYRLDIGEITEKQYYKKLAAARKKYLKEGTDAWKDSYKQSFDYMKKTADAETSTILSSLEALQSARDGAMQKMVDNAALYSKESVTIPETVKTDGKWTITTSEHTKDGMDVSNSRLREALAQNKKYEELRKKLIAKGANEYIIETFDGLSVDDAILYAEAVLAKSSTEFADYNTLSGKVKADSQKRADRMYKSQLDDLRTGFVDKVNAIFKGLNGDMALHGQEMVNSLLDGWNEAWSNGGLKGKIGFEDIVNAGTISTAPTGAKQAAAKTVEQTVKTVVQQNSTTTKTLVPVNLIFGTEKMGSFIIEMLNGEIKKIGKNPLNT